MGERIGTERRKHNVIYFAAITAGEMGFVLMYKFGMDFQNYILTEIAGFSTSFAANIVMVLGVLSMIVAPAFGAVMDKTEWKNGHKYSTWMFILPPVVAGLYILMALSLKLGASPILVVVLILLANVSADSLLFDLNKCTFASVAADPAERTLATTVSNWNKSIGQLIALVLGSSVILYFSSSGSQWDATGLLYGVTIYGIAGVILFYIAALTFRHNIEDTGKLKVKAQEKTPFFRVIKLALSNKLLLVVLVTIIFTNCRGNLANQIQSYYFIYVIGDASKYSTYALYVQIASIIGVMLIPAIKRWLIKETKWIFVITVALNAFSHFAVLLLPRTYSMFVLTNIIGNATYAIKGAFELLLLANAVDAVRYKMFKGNIHSVVPQGVTMAMFSMGLGICKIICGYVRNACLAGIGYSSGIESSPALADGFVTLYALMPGIGMLAGALFFMFFYKLPDKKLNDMKAEMDVAVG